MHTYRTHHVQKSASPFSSSSSFIPPLPPPPVYIARSNPLLCHYDPQPRFDVCCARPECALNLLEKRKASLPPSPRPAIQPLPRFFLAQPPRSSAGNSSEVIHPIVNRKPVSSGIITRRNPRRINREVSATGRKARSGTRKRKKRKEERGRGANEGT